MEPIWLHVDQLDLARLDQAEKAWVAKAVAGAFVADGHVTEGEQHNLDALLHLIQDLPALQKEVLAIVASNRPPDLPPIKTDPRLALKIYKVILDICAADLEMHPHEIGYLIRLTHLLGLDSGTARSLLKTTIQMIRIEYFLTLLPKLDLPERRWLATAVVKLVWADGRVENRELDYLSHVYHLLTEDEKYLAQLKSDPQNQSLASLGQVHFEPILVERMVLYLVEMTISDDRLEPHGLEVAVEAAQALGLNETQVSSLITKAEHFLAL